MSEEQDVDILGLYTRDVARYPLLTPQQEKEVGAKAYGGDEDAQQHLVNSNLRFVIAVAKKYRNRGVPFLDLIQAGSIGLQAAARKFNPDMGVRFIAYAIHWVRQAIQKELDATTGAIRASQTQMVRNRTVRRLQEEARHRLGRELSVEEIAEKTGFTVERVEEAMSYRVVVHSLDQPLRESEEEGSTSLAGVIAHDDGLDEREEHGERRIVLEQVFEEVLNDREAGILREYYGIGTRQLSLSEIGHRRDITRERARQLKHRALRKLRDASEHHGTLKDFFVTVDDLERRRRAGRSFDGDGSMEATEGSGVTAPRTEGGALGSPASAASA